jgi:hypothetical protein
MSESMAVQTTWKAPAKVGPVADCKSGAGMALQGSKSSSIQLKDHPSRYRDKWLRRLAHEYLVIDGLFPWKDIRPKENCPEWVHRVELEYLLAVHRDAELRTTTELTPARIGGFLGFQCAYAVWMVESLNAMIEDIIEDATKNPEKYEGIVQKKEDCEKNEILLRRFNEWYAALRHLAGRALKSCVYQSYEDMSEFLAAYSRAFSKKPKLGAGIGDFGSTTFAIYHFMLWNWRVVEQLNSVRSLHDTLRKSMGEYRVGELKRVEKICQRVGLHYRKPGRPKTSQ